MQPKLPPNMPLPKEQGDKAENYARQWLQQQGLTFVQRNFNCRHGEIDIIMQDQTCLVFVEVRYRSHPHYGGPRYSVSARKQQKLIASAHYFLQQNPLWQQHSCRFDLCAITTQQCTWIKHAFDAYN
jgi:putative endonuclease